MRETKNKKKRMTMTELDLVSTMNADMTSFVQSLLKQENITVRQIRPAYDLIPQGDSTPNTSVLIHIQHVGTFNVTYVNYTWAMTEQFGSSIPCLTADSATAMIEKIQQYSK